MARIVLLGTGAALSDASRDNTFLVVQGQHTAVLVDCTSSPFQKLACVGVPPLSIDHVILTHHHPDHISAIGLFILDLWLAQREKPLHLHALPETWGATQKILNAFEWKQWRDIFPVRYHPVAKHKIVRLLMTPELTFAAVTVNHFVPTLAIRVTHRANHRVAVYSSDTAPSGALVELARGADLLLHEATALDQDVPGHSSAVNAGQVAQRAGVKQLVLLHLPPNVVPAQWRAAARRNFKGPIMVARDYDEFEL